MGVKSLAVAGLLLVVPRLAGAQEPVFDLHVHLRDGAASVDEYEAQVASAKRRMTAFGAMWFGGPRQARQGDVAGTRAQNDALIALSAKNPKVLPIATVHPYDGQAALDEVTRLAERGVRALKLHAHTGGQGAEDDVRVRAHGFDISATVVLAADSPIEAEFVWTRRNVGIDRVFLGSDFPQFSLPQTLDALERLDLDDSEKARIRYGNARRLPGR